MQISIYHCLKIKMWDGYNKQLEELDDMLKDNQKQKTFKASDYIKMYKLKKYELRDTTEELLPPAAYIGTMFLIKNNTIMRVFTQYILESNMRIRLEKKESDNSSYRSNIHILYFDLDDVKKFKNYNDFIGYDELNSSSMKRTLSFILNLIKADFEIYLLP